MKQVIIAVVVDTQAAKFYNKLGGTVVVEQGDPRLASLMEKATPALSQGLEIELDFSVEKKNFYKEYENTSSGIVKFFKVAKNKIKEFFAIPEYPEDVPVTQLGVIPVVETKKQKNVKIVAEIMQHAEPTKSDTFLDKEDDKEIIALVNNQIIPNVEGILPQVANSVKQSNTVGLDKFMERLSAVASKRSHSVEDLMKFMSKADLPIADDGCIIIYKVLKTLPNKSGFYDCHTGRVNQNIGSYVHMDESLVDPNRRNECSNGLHVARRGYLGNFNGDVLVLAKVAPEDVIAVPQYDANKMRVCGYHILFKLSAKDHQKLKQNKPMTDSMEAAQLLAKAISGDHVTKLQSVKITGHMGNSVVITSLVQENKITKLLQANVIQEDTKQVEAINVDDADDIKAPPVKISDVTDAIKKEMEKLEPTKEIQPQESRAEIVHKLMLIVKGKKTPMEQGQAKDQIKAIKKKSKVSWAKLGISEADVKRHFSK